MAHPKWLIAISFNSHRLLLSSVSSGVSTGLIYPILSGYMELFFGKKSLEYFFVRLQSEKNLGGANTPLATST
jgi:hypothetical protein